MTPSSPPRPAASLPPVAAGLVPDGPASRLAAPVSVIGLSAGELTSRFGRPSWTRRERPAAVWQYESAACTLDIYLYDENGASRVVHVEARDRHAAPLPPGPCLDQLQTERRPASS